MYREVQEAELSYKLLLILFPGACPTLVRPQASSGGWGYTLWLSSETSIPQ